MPATVPCNARHAQSASIEPAVAAPTEAIAKATSPASTTDRRPSASDTEPCHSAITANGTI